MGYERGIELRKKTERRERKREEYTVEMREIF